MRHKPKNSYLDWLNMILKVENLNKREIYRTWETDRPWIMAKGSSKTTDPQDGAKYTIEFERYATALKYDHVDFYF